MRRGRQATYSRTAQRLIHYLTVGVGTQTHVLELPHGRGAAGRVLAHAHGAVVLVDLAHLALLAVVVQAGIYG